MKAFLKKNWNYIVAVFVPWVIVIVYSAVRGSWVTGGGSILIDDAGSVYYPMYVELWEKVHHGGSLFFTWNAGLGTDFLVNVFRYMMSPATILILLLPKAWIANTLQFVMVAKWSLLSFTMLYFVMHTRWNEIRERRKLTGLLLSFAFCFGNVMIEGLTHIAWYDALILFPVLLLQVERMQEGKGRFAFFACMVLCFVCNVSIAVPIGIFLFLWFLVTGGGAKRTGKNGLVLLGEILLAFLSTAVVWLPCFSALWGKEGLDAKDTLLEQLTAGLMPIADFIHRWFAMEERGFALKQQPAMYCSVTVLLVAMLYVFLKEDRKRKTGVLLLTVLLIGGLLNGGLNLFWHGYAGGNEEYGSFAFLLVFMVLFMAMRVMGSFESLKMRDMITVGIVGIACMAYAFFNASFFLATYVYIVTVFVFVLVAVLVFFYLKNSIQRKNIYVILVVIGMLELTANMVVQFFRFHTDTMENLYSRTSKAVLTNKMDLAEGERSAFSPDVANYNMISGLPSPSGGLQFVNSGLQNLYQGLGLGWKKDAYHYVGATPLTNLMLNVRYGTGYGNEDFSDDVMLGENGTIQLYEFQRLAGIGYMAQQDVTDWNLQETSPFLLQNQFVWDAVKGDPIFEITRPANVKCTSAMGKDPQKIERNLGAGTHGAEQKVYSGYYDASGQWFEYDFRNGFYGENILMQFEADGETDYYIYVESDCNAYHSVVINKEVLCVNAESTRGNIFHIGKVKAGTTVFIITNAEVDDDDKTTWHLRYQVAGFSEENYQKAYEKLNSQVYQIDQWEDSRVSGFINAEEPGIMATGIPALSGFTVLVDDQPADYGKIGDALIGVPLKAGKHRVEFRYCTPYLVQGAAVSGIGLLLAFVLLFCVSEKKAEAEEENHKKDNGEI